MLVITNIRTFIIHPAEVNLVLVRVETNQPGLYGLGCATFTQRCKVVVTAIEEYIKPLLIGRDPMDTQDIWQLCNVNAYWRNGPVINNAIGGIDIALWDIKGKVANLPVYQLLGGRCREGMAVYRYANGISKEDILEKAQKLWSEGTHYIRLQIAPADLGIENKLWKTKNPKDGFHTNPDQYIRANLEVFEYVRKHMGFEPKLLHDVHERLLPLDAIFFAKELEPMKLFFLEDLFSPEQWEYLRILRNQCSIPIAQGELFVNPNEWIPLIKDRLIDFIRVHISTIGGLTPAVKLAHLCDAFGVRLAWHGPNDMTPIGHTAQLHIDISSQNFGIKEWPWVIESAPLHEVFPGMPELHNGYIYPNDKPGFGVDFDETSAKKYPWEKDSFAWTQYRYEDSSIQWP
jgi:mannonate dehydratase